MYWKGGEQQRGTVTHVFGMLVLLGPAVPTVGAAADHTLPMAPELRVLAVAREGIRHPRWADRGSVAA